MSVVVTISEKLTAKEVVQKAIDKAKTEAVIVIIPSRWSTTPLLKEIDMEFRNNFQSVTATISGRQAQFAVHHLNIPSQG